jgi:hypothetical protein
MRLFLAAQRQLSCAVRNAACRFFGFRMSPQN